MSEFQKCAECGEETRHTIIDPEWLKLNLPMSCYSESHRTPICYDCHNRKEKERVRTNAKKI